MRITRPTETPGLTSLTSMLARELTAGERTVSLVSRTTTARCASRSAFGTVPIASSRSACSESLDTRVSSSESGSKGDDRADLYPVFRRPGNHGEDVKEQYWYLDSTPTHSYMKMLYKYPQREYPYEQLVRESSNRGRDVGSTLR